MALFGKKTTTKEAPPEQEAVSTDDFSPEALAALAESLDSGEADVKSGSAVQVRKPVSFKNGSVLGINIGADTMKAVELTAKNGSCTVTGVAIAPTPPDSIANGVVMSVNVLADAVKELIAPFKTKKVVTSVAGTGEVIVRVIEVPTMTDAELQENMTTDLDRYIPFPPSEVQWDAAAMRDLPMDPNATNMDVLLVAARHELIDLHLQLLAAVKVDPKAIDVEPLAAARALSGPLSENSTHVDYNDVVAVLDIGASSTEISILRGDELVFTRTVPVAGNTMTQALMDKLNLPHMDAERLKREKGDASPAQDVPAVPPSASTNIAPINENTDVAQSDVSSGFDDIILSDEPPTETGDVPADVPAESSDPFDLDLFNQGPTQSEPGEQHQQKMPDSAGGEDDASQLPSKKPEGDADTEVDGDDVALPSKADAAQASVPEPATGGAIASFFDFDEKELDEHSEQLPTIEGKPQHTEAPPHEEEETGTINWDDDSFLPSVATTETTGATLPSAFTFPDAESPAPAAPVVKAAVEPVAIPQPSAFSLDSSTPAPAAEEKSTLPPVAEEIPAEKAPVEDIDLSDILSDTPESTPALDMDEGLGGTIALDEGVGLGDSLSGLGTGLDVEEKPHDEAAVHAVLKPIFDDLASELRRSLEYHSARYPDAPVRRIVLVGGGAKMHNLDTYFSQNLGVPASIGNPFHSLDVDASQVNQQLVAEQGSALVVALGLAMREIIR